MKRILIATSVVAAIIAIFIVWHRPAAVDVYPNEQLNVDGTTRYFRVVIPRTISKPAPIAFAFHGMGDSTESMANYSRLDRLASRNGFILVYPAAQKSMWTTIDVSPGKLDSNSDVRFFDQLLIYFSTRYEIDRDRVYAIGMSNGASFAQLLAFARSKDLAAVVAHSGSKPHTVGTSPNRIPIMLVVGGEDPASTAMQTDAAQYRSAGHFVQIITVPALAHEWSTAHNTQMWEFLSQHPSSRG